MNILMLFVMSPITVTWASFTFLGGFAQDCFEASEKWKYQAQKPAIEGARTFYMV